MVIIRLMGGLGNQLFQYAIARRIATINKDVLKLDITYCKSSSLRKYALSHFNIMEEFALPREIVQLRKGGQLNKFLNHFRKVPHFPKSYVKERFLQFDPTVFNLTGDIYLDGYWQSEKYFLDIRQTIQNEFTVKTKPTELNIEMAKKINDVNSVSLHVRRTDYVTNKEANQHHGTCSLEYYQSAINLITQKVSQPYFFVFSDDPIWSQENLKINFPVTFVIHNGIENAYEDLRLMNLCNHHIIANSSFSWWGAWLCQNKEKIVITPQKWFNITALDTSDHTPQSWIKI